MANSKATSKTKAGAEAGDKDESAFRWWMRYVVVPVLGGGGLFSLAAVLLTGAQAQNAAKPAIAAVADGGASAVRSVAPVAGATPTTGALDDLARTAAARFVQAMLSEDHAALVDMVDEPVHVSGKLHLTRLSLRCALEADRHQPLVPGMDKLAGRDLAVKRLAAADLGLFPGAREGDYLAQFAGGGQAGAPVAGAQAAGGLQLHLRPRGTSFVVLRIVQGSA